MKTKNAIHPPITQEIKDKIIERWRFSPLNSIPQLAKEFNCQEKQVHNCINNYLASKIGNGGLLLSGGDKYKTIYRLITNNYKK